MTHNTGPILAGDHTVVYLTKSLLRNVNKSVYTANSGHHLYMLLIFLQYLHPSAANQRPILSPGMHGECKAGGQNFNRRETTLLKCTEKSGDEENRDGTNNAPCPASYKEVPSLGPQRRKRRNSATSAHTSPKEGNRRSMWSNDNGKSVQDDAQKRQGTQGAGNN